MAVITQLAWKKIDLIFPNVHVLAEREFVKRFIVEPKPSIIYNPGLSRDMLVEFSRRCDLYEIALIGYEFKDTDMMPIESHSYEQYCEENIKGWVMNALNMNADMDYSSLLFPVVHISPEKIQAYL